MTPYYDGAGVRIFHGEALRILQSLPDASVDAVVVAAAVTVFWARLTNVSATTSPYRVS